MTQYHFALLGHVDPPLASLIGQSISNHTSGFGISVGREITISCGSNTFQPSPYSAAAAAYFGGSTILNVNLQYLLEHGIPIVPVATTIGRFSQEIPTELQFINGLSMDRDGAEAVALILLECAGLLPRQRRVFVSYRRSEASAAATQLFDALSGRHYDVFLDTHGVAPAKDFQSVLWHRLCDSDVLIMLDSETYFESRWSSTEFGRALAKNIAVLRVGLPNVKPSTRVATAFQLQLDQNTYDQATGLISPQSLLDIATMLESARSRSHAVRNLQLFSMLKLGIETIGGAISGTGARGVVRISLPNGRPMSLMTVIGVPTSESMQEAIEQSQGDAAAVVFDHIGLSEGWLEHLSWLQGHVAPFQWVKVTEAAWQLAAIAAS